MEPVSKSTRIAIIKTELEAYSNSIYVYELRARVAKRLEDKEGGKKLTEELVKLETARDFLMEELDKVEKEE
jgi:hypothetical protein